MNNNIKDSYSTKVTDHDLAIADKDRDGVLYSTDGKRLLGIERKDFSAYKYVIKEGTEVICDHAFSCSSIRNIVIPDSVIVIGERAFNECTSLKYVDIGKGVKIIKTFAFSHCNTLENVNISNSITKISKFAFYGCFGIKEFIIPKTVEYIGKSAFQFCRNLKAVYIPDSVKYIGFKAFNDCQWITVHRTGRRTWREYDSMNLIATTPGNKDKLVKMLPKFLHSIIKEMTYKEFVNREKSLYSNVNTEEEYDFGSLERVKCPRCGNWYFEDDGVCDICGYPWNE